MFICPKTRRLRNSVPDILDGFLSLPKSGTGADCIGTIILSIGKIPSCSGQCMWWRKKCLLHRFSNPPKHVHICRLPNFTMRRMLPSTLIGSLVAIRSLQASRQVMWHFQWGLRQASLKRFGPAPASSKNAMENNPDLFTLIPTSSL